MRFAFSSHNPGNCEGAFGGLGSAHTEGTWTLGDVQRLGWLRASGLDESPGWRRLTEIAAPDGLLPGTYDSRTGAWHARRWFA